MKHAAYLWQGDSLAVLDTIVDATFDSCVTDPPYHLTQVSRGGSCRTNDTSTPYGRARVGSKGFMGKTWDGGDVAFDPEYWKQVYRVLKPGANLLAFGGGRTYHRLATAIEAAGFVIIDQLMWIYGQGFPKSHDIQAALIKQGMSTDEAARWAGWETALKPAHEPICFAFKPREGTYAANIVAHGVGGINVDECRIDLNGGYKSKANGRPSQTGLSDNYDPTEANQPDSKGRWPANVLLSEEAAEALDAQSGSGKNRTNEASALSSYAEAGATDFAMKPGPRGGSPNGRWPANVLLSEEAAEALDAQSGLLKSGACPAGDPATIYADTAGTSKFFFCAKASQKERREGCDVNKHPTVKPLKLMRWLCRLITPPGGFILDPFVGSGSTGVAALKEGFVFGGIDEDPESIETARRRIQHAAGTGTVKLK